MTTKTKSLDVDPSTIRDVKPADLLHINDGEAWYIARCRDGRWVIWTEHPTFVPLYYTTEAEAIAAWAGSADAFRDGYPDNAFDPDPPGECLYCGAKMENADSDVVPAVGDDEAWEAQAQLHAEGCEWVETRAHRRNDA